MKKLVAAFVLLIATAASAFAASTINTALPQNGQPYSASVIRGNFSGAANDINALYDLNVGSSAPLTCNLANIGTPWLNNATTPYTLTYCDGTGSWLVAGSWDVVNHIFTPPTGRGAQQTLTVGATIDLGSVPQSSILASGSGASITSLGTSAKAGDLKIVQFNGANTLVYNAVTLILPGASSATTAANQTWLFESLGGGNWLAVASNTSSGGGGGGGVTSFNGRTGAVVPASNDYNFSQIAGQIAYSQNVTPLQSGTTNYIPYWISNIALANGSPAIIAGIIGGGIALPGGAVNIVASLSTAGTTVTVTADAVIACSALSGGNCYTLGSYSQAFAGTTVGAGGMDTGSIPSAGFLCLYAIYNPTTVTQSILGTNCATSNTTIYGGSHLPSGYTASMLLGFWQTNNTPAMVAGSIQGGYGLAQLGQFPTLAPIGVASNTAGTLSAPSSSVTITADQIVVGTYLNGITYVLSSYSQSFNSGTTGAGGMDTGTLPSSGNVCIYAIFKPSTATESILGVNCATSSGSIYSGTHMPSGYTASGLLGRWATNSTPAMVGGTVAAPFPFAVSNGTVALPVTPPGGRLTLLSHTPVMTTTQSAKSTVYYDSYISNSVFVYNGASDVQLVIGSNEISTAMQTSGTGVINTSDNFDVWAVNVSSALTLCIATNGSGGGWASDTGGSVTARGTGYTQLDFSTRPYVTNKNALATCYNGSTNEGSVAANQATYLGTLTTTGAGQTSWIYGVNGAPPTAAVFGLWNYYNRVPVFTQLGETTTSWTYASATVREINGDTTAKVTWVTGLAADQFTTTYLAPFSSGTSGFPAAGVCADVTNAFSGGVGMGANNVSGTGGITGNVYAIFAQNVIGKHVNAACESAPATGTQTFYGTETSGGPQSILTFVGNM